MHTKPSPADPMEVAALRQEMSTWFLGPKSENRELLKQLLEHVLDDHVHWRMNYYPRSAPIVTELEKLDDSYLRSAATMRQHAHELLDRLKTGFPFYSPRYLAHMLHDVTIPALVGYFAGMLYNANNVTYEASPVTTQLESEVARDLAGLVGYDCAVSD